MVHIQAREDLQTLLLILPQSIREHLEVFGNQDELLEVVLDLGRVPTARFVDGEKVIRDVEVNQAEINMVVEGVGDFDDDNRAGIARTLHRISCIRNRRGQIVGLTCRVGRAVVGTIDIIQDIVDEGHSILLLGRPGVGKTTMLREMARILAEKKRVVIVDTSNEIGGDGDIPHPAIGKARRMLIDEIGREREATAARTINERGVQLIGTAHGNTLENLMLNPTLSDLVGGIESVTLSDEEARRRGTQKTVLERRAPPTFDVLIEIQDRQKLLAHRDVTDAIDRMLRGEPLQMELRFRDEGGNIQREQQTLRISSPAVTGRRGGRTARDTRELMTPEQGKASVVADRNGGNGRVPAANIPIESTETRTLKVYAYGVARNRLYQAAKSVNARVIIEEDLREADVLVTLKSYYRKKRRLINDAENRRKPVYVLRANTVQQMERFLIEALGLEVPPNDPFDSAVAEAEEAIELVQAGQQSVDLSPVGSALRRYQHQLARNADLVSHSYGHEPRRHVRIFSTRRN